MASCKGIARAPAAWTILASPLESSTPKGGRRMQSREKSGPLLATAEIRRRRAVGIKAGRRR